MKKKYIFYFLRIKQQFRSKSIVDLHEITIKHYITFYMHACPIPKIRIMSLCMD